MPHPLFRKRDEMREVRNNPIPVDLLGFSSGKALNEKPDLGRGAGGGRGMMAKYQPRLSKH